MLRLFPDINFLLCPKHEKLKRSEERIEHLEGKIKIFQADRAKLQAINKSHQKKLSVLEENIDAARTVCTNLNDFCTRAEGKIKEFQSRKLDLEAQQRDLKTERESLSAEVTSLLQKLSLRETTIQENTAALGKQNETILSLETENSNLGSVITNLRQQLGMTIISLYVSNISV